MTETPTATTPAAGAVPNGARTAVRQDWVDHAKGVGIVLVVFGHVIAGVRDAGIRIDDQVFRITWDSIYAFHIPLFFFLSGLFFPHSWSRRGFRGIIENKVDTLVYPYVLWSLLQGLLQVSLGNHVNNPVTIGEVLSLLWHPRQEFWFLYALFFTYVIACVAYAIVPPRRRWILVVMALLLYFVRTYVPHVAAIWYPPWYLIYFLAGALIPGTATFLVKRATPSLPTFIVLFVLAELARQAFAGPQADPRLSMANLAAASAGIAATIALAALLSRASFHLTSLLGRMSLQIYLLHTMAAACVRLVMQKLLGIEGLAIHLIVGTSVGVFGPLAFAYLLERWSIPGLFSPPVRLSLAPQGPPA